MATSSTHGPNVCAACGKEYGGGGLKTCAACKSVKYCNASCQEAHRPAHKKACKKRAAKLHEEALFREPPAPDDCAICCLPHSVELVGGFDSRHYKTCCGKTLCYGCQFTMTQKSSRREKKVCAFCRQPCAQTVKEDIKRAKKRMAVDDADAFEWMAGRYTRGDGVPQDHRKAVELWRRAGELGSTEAMFNLGVCYRKGDGVNIDAKEERRYLELAAMKGHALARHNLACYEGNKGDSNRAMKHFMIAASGGDKWSLDEVQKGCQLGTVTKNDFGDALRAFQKSTNEAKSEQRDKAAAHLSERMNSLSGGGGVTVKGCGS